LLEDLTSRSVFDSPAARVCGAGEGGLLLP
jgi:hypothetical protein